MAEGKPIALRPEASTKAEPKPKAKKAPATKTQ
jgi:hypothetical protein